MKTHPYVHRSLLTVAGLTLALGAMAGEDKMQLMDSNKDGKISVTEHAAGARQMFQEMDANHDGKVDAAEMDAMHAQMKPADHSGPTMSSADKIKTIDTNNDGVITAAEHEAGSRAMFAKMDADGDGNLTSTEMQAGHQKMMSEKPR
jgi:Ca2+-binding EF-hand superfamily protein